MGDALQSQAKSGGKTRSTRQAQQDGEVSKRGIFRREIENRAYVREEVISNGVERVVEIIND